MGFNSSSINPFRDTGYALDQARAHIACVSQYHILWPLRLHMRCHTLLQTGTAWGRRKFCRVAAFWRAPVHIACLPSSRIIQLRGRKLYALLTPVTTEQASLSLFPSSLSLSFLSCMLLPNIMKRASAVLSMSFSHLSLQVFVDEFTCIGCRKLYKCVWEDL